MELQQYVGVGQSAALTLAFLYLIWNVPAMLEKWLSFKASQDALKMASEEKNRQWQREEGEADREARHKTSAVYQASLAEIFKNHKAEIDSVVAALSALRESVHNRKD